MADPKWAWLSGVFDGEGCVLFRVNHGLLQVGLGVGMCHFDAMEQVEGLLVGIGVVPRWSEQRMSSGRYIFRVETMARSSVRLWAHAMLPYSVVKKDEIEAALAALQLTDNASFPTGHADPRRNLVHKEAIRMINGRVKHRKFSEASHG